MAEARQPILGSLRMELVELPNIEQKVEESLDALTKPKAHHNSSISPALYAALESYLPTKTAIFT